MALATLTELRGMLTIDDTVDDVDLQRALDAASVNIRTWCGTDFEPTATTQTRKFGTCNGWAVGLGSSVIGTTVGLVVATDDDDDGTAETTWTITTDFELDPLDGVGPDGRTGWPARRLVAVGSKTFPYAGRRPTPVHVTATWGWAAVPTPVSQAALLLAYDLWWSRTAPHGSAGFGQVPPAQLVRQNFTVQELLAPYRAGEAIVGIA